MQALLDLKLDVIDHRSWHSRFENIVINEMYVKTVSDTEGDWHRSPDQTLNSIKAYLENLICQEVS